MARNDGTDDLRTELSEENGFCTLEVRAKRGSGTRDEDRVTATLARDTLEEVEDHRESLLAMVRGTVEDARAIQPDAAEEDGE